MAGIRVVMLTNAYPFGSWEPFLETEVAYYTPLTSVDLFALSIRPEMYAKVRETPSNVTVHPIAFRSRLYYLLWGLTSLWRRDFYEELSLLIRSRRLSWTRFVKLIVFIARANYEAQIIIRTLRTRGTGPRDRRVLYSYRMEYHAYLAALIRRAFPNFKVVLRGHGYDLYEELDRTGYMPMRKKSFLIADRLSAVSEYGATYLRERYPEIADRVTLHRLGTADYGLAPSTLSGEFRLLSCSAVVPVKRLDRIVKALELMTDRPVRWVHFGGGPLLADIQAQADALPPNVTVELRGPLPHYKLMMHLAKTSYDVFINTSESEGIPVSIMEALSFGIPVVATDVGGTSEIVVNGESGRLVLEPFNPDDIAKALLEIADAPAAVTTALRRSARDFWERHYNANDRYPSFVRNLIKLGHNEQ